MTIYAQTNVNLIIIINKMIITSVYNNVHNNINILQIPPQYNVFNHVKIKNINIIYSNLIFVVMIVNIYNLYNQQNVDKIVVSILFMLFHYHQKVIYVHLIVHILLLMIILMNNKYH